MSAEPPPEPELPRVKSRLPFEAAPKPNLRASSLAVYGVLTVGMIALALYTAFVLRLPPTSGYVAGPAIGALWFGLRLFMIWGSKT